MHTSVKHIISMSIKTIIVEEVKKFIFEKYFTAKLPTNIKNIRKNILVKMLFGTVTLTK